MAGLQMSVVTRQANTPLMLTEEDFKTLPKP